MAVVYITIEKFTNKAAGATRIFSICNLLASAKRDVIVLSLDEVEPQKINFYHAFKFISLRSTSKSILSRIFNLILHKKRLKKTLIYLKKQFFIEEIFFYDIPFHSILFLKRFAKENKIRIFHDSVEWYSPQQFRWGRLALPYILKNCLNKYLIDKQIAVLAISTFLYNYFISKGIRTLQVPVMFDTQRISYKKNCKTNKLILLYAGAPGRKDYLKEIVEGIAILKEDELKNIEFRLLGINKNQLRDKCLISAAIIKKCGNSLIAKGRVPRSEVFNELQNADFTVLLRSPVLRYAKAGFPTKVVESLATATPIICNLTSDLGKYLKDGENCLIVETFSAKAFAEAIRRALSLSIEEKKMLSYNARITAERYFDYRIYINQFNHFICES